MKNAILLMLSTVWLVACSPQLSTNNSPTDSFINPDFSVEISKLQSLGVLSLDTTNSSLGFGTFNPTSATLSKIINVKNESSASVDLSIGSLTTGSGFTVKTNRCGLSLSPKSSCAITIAFSSRGLYTGSTFDYLPLASGTNQAAIELIATIENQPNPSTAEPSLLYTLSSTTSGKTLTVKNNGPGNASNIVVTPPAGYSILLSRCGGVLKSGTSCVVTLMFNNYRSQPQPTIGTIAIVAAGTQPIPPVFLSVVDGSPVATPPTGAGPLKILMSGYAPDWSANLGMFFSSNGGTSYSPYSPSIPAGINLSDRVYISGSNVLIKGSTSIKEVLLLSKNGGVSFSEVATPPELYMINLVSMSGNRILLRGQSSDYSLLNPMISNDLGSSFSTFSLSSSGLSNEDLGDVMLSGNNILFRSGNSFKVSTDGGATFSSPSLPAGMASINLMAYGDANTIFIQNQSEDYSVVKYSVSTDGGATYTIAALPTGVTGVGMAYVTSSGIILRAEKDGAEHLFLSTDKCQTYSEISLPAGVGHMPTLGIGN